MATSKRQRHKEGRQRRLEEQRRAATRANRRRTLVRMVLLAAAVFGLAALVASLGGDDDGTGATDDAGTTGTTEAAGEPVALTPPPPGEAIEGPTPCPPPEGADRRVTTFSEPPPMCIDPAVDYRAELVTSKGTVTIDLLEDRAPATVNNFVVLSRYHFYEGIPFHRIVQGFVVQGGDPEATGGGGPGYEFADELPQDGAYQEGSVAMANSGPGTNGSQFFIVTDGADRLEPNYSLFGQVTDGMDVVRQIEAAGSSSSEGTPTEEITIDEVRILEG